MNEDKAKCVFLGVLLAVVIVFVITVGYCSTLNPEIVSGVVTDKEKVVTQTTHYNKDTGFWVTYSTSYRVKLMVNDQEEELTTDSGTYGKLKVGQEGQFKVSGVKWMGRVVRAEVE